MKRGFTLVETLVAVFAFLVIALSVYQGFVAIINLVQASRARTVATMLAGEQIEIMRNLRYSQVGIPNSIPNGIWPRVQALVRGGISFIATTTIRNVDDPFDGTIGGSPNDQNPADYKLAEVLINCATCRLSQPLTFTATIAPKSLETSTGNGALFVRVLDANGLPVSGANVHIENNKVSPPIVIDDLTNNSGVLQLVDVPPGSFAYEVKVTKSGYSSNQTYPPGAGGNPNPVNPHSTVVVGQVTQITLPIDRVSQFNFATLTTACVPVPTASFNLRGNKLIGTNPNVLAYNQDQSTDGTGQKSVTSLAWDTYTLTLNGSSYDLAGSVPLLPFTLPPQSSQNVSLILAPKSANALLVTVRDSASALPLTGASVTLSRGSFNQNLMTDRGFFRQTDWSGGAGQADFNSSTRYFSDDGNIDATGLAGQLQLRPVFGHYASSGVLTSSTFDTGSTTQSTFYNLSWNPATQPPATGATSLKFQIATTNDSATSTWDYLGPDGTSNTYYAASGSNINAAHNGQRYLRYRAYLSTADTNVTPALADLAITYGSGCLPFGQVFFNGLTGASNYDLLISKSGYQTYHNDAVSVTNPWQALDVSLLNQ